MRPLGSTHVAYGAI